MPLSVDRMTMRDVRGLPRLPQDPVEMEPARRVEAARDAQRNQRRLMVEARYLRREMVRRETRAEELGEWLRRAGGVDDGP